MRQMLKEATRVSNKTGDHEDGPQVVQEIVKIHFTGGLTESKARGSAAALHHRSCISRCTMLDCASVEFTITEVFRMVEES